MSYEDFTRKLFRRMFREYELINDSNIGIFGFRLNYMFNEKKKYMFFKLHLLLQHRSFVGRALRDILNVNEKYKM